MGGALDRDGNKKIYFRKRDEKLLKKTHLRKRFENIGVLIIDEILMLYVVD